jgi:predicted aldo/keto reductase-like oxidoreductase
MDRHAYDTDRRRFLTTGLAGLAGAALAPAALHAQAAEKPKTDKKERPIVERTLGRTGIRVPVVSMGAGASVELMKAAFDAGIRLVDTSEVYNNGNHELQIAQAIKGRPRDSFVIATKVYIPFNQRTGVYPEGTTGEPIAGKVEASLKRLGIDCVDILMLHDVVRKEAAQHESILNGLVKAREQGKTRFIGLSVHSHEPEVIHAAVDAKVYDVILTAYNFRQPHLAEVQAAVERAAKAGLGIMAMKTQAGVFWDRERQQPINMKAALKWALQNPHIHTAIPGFSSFDQMEEDLSIMADLALTDQEKKDLQLGEEKKMTGLYCSQCRRCVGQCPSGVEIPALMRAYMYTYGYRNLAWAKEAVTAAGSGPVPCADCRSCLVKCTMGFDIRAKVLDIGRLRDVPAEFVV